MQAIILHKIGSPENLKIENVEDPKPKNDEVIVTNKAIGINFFDHAFRSGQYKLNKLPAILGVEGCGVIS